MGVLSKLTEALFGDKIRELTEKQLAGQVQVYGDDMIGAILRMVGGGNIAYMPDNVESYIKDGYLFNPVTYSIVSYIAQKAANVPFGVYEVKDEKALRMYKSAGPDFSIAKMKMYKKALIEVPDHEFNEIFIRPNPLQGWAEFIEQVVGFKLVTGNSFIHAVGPDNGINSGKITELWQLPTQLIEIVAGDQYEPVREYRMKADRSVVIPPEEMIHLKYWTPEYIGASFLWGLSPIRAARRVISRSNASYDSSLASFQNMGALGFVSSDAGPNDPGLTPEVASEIERRLAEKTGPKNRGKHLVTSANLKWQQIGMSPVDLAILESDKLDLRSQCNIFHVPSELFGDSENKTYSNTKEAGKAIYNNAVLPALNQFRDAVNKHLNRVYGDRFYIDYDATMLPEMQQDINAMTTALQGAWWLTPNERRELMVWPRDTSEPLMDAYMVPMGLLPLTGYMPSDEELDALKSKYKLND